MNVLSVLSQVWPRGLQLGGLVTKPGQRGGVNRVSVMSQVWGRGLQLGGL